MIFTKYKKIENKIQVFRKWPNLTIHIDSYFNNNDYRRVIFNNFNSCFYELEKENKFMAISRQWIQACVNIEIISKNVDD